MSSWCFSSLACRPSSALRLRLGMVVGDAGLKGEPLAYKKKVSLSAMMCANWAHALFLFRAKWLRGTVCGFLPCSSKQEYDDT